MRKKEGLAQVDPQLYEWLRTFNAKPSYDSVAQNKKRCQLFFASYRRRYWIGLCRRAVHKGKDPAITLTAGSFSVERIMGVEPTSTAWEAVVLPMNYIRIFICQINLPNSGEKVKGKSGRHRGKRGGGAGVM